MIATTVEYKGKTYYVSAKSLDNPELTKIWAFEDEGLTKMVKKSQKTFMFKKSDVKYKLK